MDVILYCIQKECINYLKELNVENEQIVEYEGLYSEEMQQIRKICLEDMTKVIEKYLSNNFDSSSVLPINNFLENYQISSKIIHMNSVFNKTTIENSLVQLQECIIIHLNQALFLIFSLKKLRKLILRLTTKNGKRLTSSQIIR